MKTAVILAGGKGTRLGRNSKPKAMLKVRGKTLIQHQLDWLKEEGFTHVIICLGFKHKQVEFKTDLDFYISIERKLLGTGGAVKKGIVECASGDSLFYVLNVDDLAPVDTSNILEDYYKLQTPCIVVKKNPASIWTKEGSMYPQNATFTHIGHTILSKVDVFNLPPKGSLEQWLSTQKNININIHDDDWETCNTLEQLRELNGK